MKSGNTFIMRIMRALCNAAGDLPPKMTAGNGEQMRGAGNGQFLESFFFTATLECQWQNFLSSESPLKGEEEKKGDEGREGRNRGEEEKGRKGRERAREFTQSSGRDVASLRVP
jgi:hypothetical protein